MNNSSLPSNLQNTEPQFYALGTPKYAKSEKYRKALLFIENTENAYKHILQVMLKLKALQIKLQKFNQINYKINQRWLSNPQAGFKTAYEHC